MRAAAERFWERVSPEPTSGCWLWTGGVEDGYGRLYLRKPDGSYFHEKAHRFSYQLLVGPIPHGLELDHLCRVRCCVNPAHLEAVTHAVNVARGRGIAPKNMAKTHCKQGHPLAGENLVLEVHKGRTYRQCRTCIRARKLAWYHQNYQHRVAS